MSAPRSKLPAHALAHPAEFVDSLTLEQRIAMARRRHIVKRRKRTEVERLIVREGKTRALLRMTTETR